VLGRLRVPLDFRDESRKTQGEIDVKKQALDTAQQKLADLQEEGRRAGMPPGAVQ